MEHSFIILLIWVIVRGRDIIRVSSTGVRLSTHHIKTANTLLLVVVHVLVILSVLFGSGYLKE